MLSERRNILLVEDDDQVANLYRIALTDERFWVTHVHDGIDALRYVEQRLPDLVILDLGLPRLDGKSVAQELRGRANTRHIPIVVVTGLSGQTDNLPSECVLRKPIDVGHLTATVRDCLRRSTITRR